VNEPPHDNHLRRRLVTAGTALLVLAVLVILADALPRVRHLLVEPTASDSEVHLVLNDVSRTMGVSLSMLVALCAIAIPLTANVYTPKLIELFVSDRANQLMLGYYVVANAVVLWNRFLLTDMVLPSARLRVLCCVGLCFVGLLLIIPCVYHVLRFLVPKSIVARLEQEIQETLEQASKTEDPDELARLRNNLLETIQYLGNITLRSVDRYDRETALGGLNALRSVFYGYQARKPRLPKAWFRLTRRETQILWPELSTEVERQRSAIEVAVLQEFALVLPLAIGRLPEVVGRLAVLSRRFGVRTTESSDMGAREIVTLHFNTFLRVALQRRHSDTFYKFVYQYRRLAEDILEADSEHALRVAFFLDYYGHQAVRMGLGFLINVVAYDLAALCDLAYRTQAACRQQILDTLIALDRDRERLIDMPGVVKAQMILAAKLHSRGELDASRALCDELRKVPREQLEDDFVMIVSAHEENFWEIADRRKHLDHVEARYRPSLETLRRELTGHDQPGPNTRRFLGSGVRGGEADQERLARSGEFMRQDVAEDTSRIPPQHLVEAVATESQRAVRARELDQASPAPPAVEGEEGASTTEASPSPAQASGGDQ
jgi:Predicted membrane protein (DUF2254)